MICRLKDRLDLLCKLVMILPQDRLHVLPSLLTEAILATKEANERARQAAFALLIAMGEKMHAGGSINKTFIVGMDASAEVNMDSELQQSPVITISC